MFVPVSDSLGVSGNLKSITFNKISFKTINFLSSEIKYIQELVNQGIKNGNVKPLATTVFPVSQVVDAFKATTCSSGMGRIVVEIRAENEAKENGLTAKKTTAALPKLFFTSEETFIISGN